MRNGQTAQARDMAQKEPAAAKDAPPAVSTDAIDQVRELLFGQDKRRVEQNHAALQAEMQKSFSDMRAELQHQVDALTNRILELERTGEKRRLESISDIGRAISELGASIQNMGAEKQRR